MAQLPPPLRGEPLYDPSAALGKLQLDASGHARADASCIMSATKPIERQAPLGFLDLPGEIRNEIYRYVLLVDRNPYHRRRAWSGLNFEALKYNMSISVLFVSRQINLEASSIFYGANNLVIIQDTNYFLFEKVLDRNLPVVACTHKASNHRFAMVLHLEAYAAPFRHNSVHQVIVAAQDL